MSSLVKAAVRSVAGKMTRSGLVTRTSRPAASTVIASVAAIRVVLRQSHDWRGDTRPSGWAGRTTRANIPSHEHGRPDGRNRVARVLARPAQTVVLVPVRRTARSEGHDAPVGAARARSGPFSARRFLRLARGCRSAAGEDRPAALPLPRQARGDDAGGGRARGAARPAAPNAPAVDANLLSARG